MLIGVAHLMLCMYYACATLVGALLQRALCSPAEWRTPGCLQAGISRVLGFRCSSANSRSAVARVELDAAVEELDV